VESEQKITGIKEQSSRYLRLEKKILFDKKMVVVANVIH
jgi:hypothetical protein